MTADPKYFKTAVSNIFIPLNNYKNLPHYLPCYMHMTCLIIVVRLLINTNFINKHCNIYTTE